MSAASGRRGMAVPEAKTQGVEGMGCQASRAGGTAIPRRGTTPSPRDCRFHIADPTV